MYLLPLSTSDTQASLFNECNWCNCIKKTAAHTLQAAAIQCRNPVATQYRETNAEGKNSSIPLHAATGPDNVYKEKYGSAWSVGKNSSSLRWL